MTFCILFPYTLNAGAATPVIQAFESGFAVTKLYPSKITPC